MSKCDLTAAALVAGLVQTAVFGVAALACLPVARPRSAAFGARMAGGFGKVLWWVRQQA